MPKSKPAEKAAPSLVTEILRGLRPYLREMRSEARAEFHDIKVRFAAFEASAAQLFTLDAAKSDRMNRIEERVDRIERHLELSE